MTPSVWHLALGVALLTSAACASPDDAQTPPASAEAGLADTLGVPAAFAARLDGAALDYVVLDRRGDALALVRASTDSGAVLLLYADLAAGARLRQTLGAPDTADVSPGLYHPTAPSPRFSLIASPALDTAFWVANGAFFETPGQPSSELAFPIATGGRVVSGGRSPYGPGRPRAHAARWGAPLRALGVSAGTVAVSSYEPATGAPLGEGTFREAVVSYAPDAHPTRLAARFHVLGPLGADALGQSTRLLWAVTDGRSRIDAPAALLARLGVRPEHQIALDGGASVSVTSARAGALERAVGDQPLPHWLTVDLR